MQYKILYACVSHLGKVRQTNQDNFICDGRYMELDGNDLIFPLCGACISSEGPLFGVFDGMGGEQCGEIAAHIAAQLASGLKVKGNGMEQLAAFCTEANQAICDRTKELDLRSIGTTAAMLLFSQKIILCNIGDSKVFRFRRGELEQLSMDHICPAPFGVKPPLSQSLGMPADEIRIEPYFLKCNYVNGDVYLICSDGLTDMLTNEEIGGILASENVENAATQLLDKALEKGGIDNTTIILCKIEKAPLSIFQLKSLRKREV